jgi:hypothetical protein
MALIVRHTDGDGNGSEVVSERNGDLDEAAGAADAIACSGGAAVCVG